ncbi:hypothetical protein SLS60_002970 [Paraconiothyrium brasiliense]|uniref:Uncharacterized protein n=1 Tax=Paraconiothyrium brasiliense TaxID=300254 RepID=A0ABR3RUB7_9PLEO
MESTASRPIYLLGKNSARLSISSFERPQTLTSLHTEPLVAKMASQHGAPRGKEIWFDDLDRIATLADYLIDSRYTTHSNHYEHLQYALRNNLTEFRQSCNAPGHRRHRPQLVLFEYIEIEHNIVEAWNLSRLGGIVPRVAEEDVLNLVHNFPLGSAAMTISKSEGLKVYLPEFPLRRRLTGYEHLPSHMFDIEAFVRDAGVSLPVHSDLRVPSVSQGDQGNGHEAAIAQEYVEVQRNLLVPGTVIGQRLPADKQIQDVTVEGSGTDEANQSGKRAKRTYAGIPEAPSCNTTFKGAGNITMVEVLTFLPTWITSRDMINRILSNGGQQSVVAIILMAHRNMPQGLEGTRNLILKKFNRGMRFEHGPTWIPSNHETPEGHDEDSIDVSGFRTQIELEGQRQKQAGRHVPPPSVSIPFKDLARGVTMMPTGADGLDLTRCVQHHLDNPDESWMFPDDLEELLNQIGGPLPVTEDHLDRSIFRRYQEAPRRRQLPSVKNVGILNKQTLSSNVSQQLNNTARTAAVHQDVTGRKSPGARKAKTPESMEIDEESSDEDRSYKCSKYADALGRKNARAGALRRSDRACKYTALDTDTDLSTMADLSGDSEDDDDSTGEYSDDEDIQQPPAKKQRRTQG